MSATETVSQTKLQASAPDFSGPVKTTLHFITPPSDGSTPYNFVEKQPEGVAQNNYATESHEVIVSDIRSKPAGFFSFDKHAFEVTQTHDSPGVDFRSDESIKTKYYPEIEELLLKQVPGAHKVVIFDHTVRLADADAKRGPVLRAHVDQTVRSAAWRVPLHVPDEAESSKLLKGRYRIINVWRPINGAVESNPLAVGDSSTLPADHLIPVEHRYPDRTGETAGVKYTPETNWWYLSNMKTNERLFLQCSDNVSLTRTPHTAFIDPRSTANSRPRESIEVRTLVFSDA